MSDSASTLLILLLLTTACVVETDDIESDSGLGRDDADPDPRWPDADTDLGGTDGDLGGIDADPGRTDGDLDASEDGDEGVVADGDGDPDADAPSRPVTFTRHTVAESAYGPAYVSVADIDGDGRLDLVTSHFGSMGATIPNGEVRVYSFAEGLDDWYASDEIVARGDRTKFPNQTTVVDVDEDGDVDVVVPAGFLACTMGGFAPPCGALFWMEQTAEGWSRHDVVAGGSALFYHGIDIADLDGDGIRDMVTVGEEKGGMFSADRVEAQWFRGSRSGFETAPREIGTGLGSFPTVLDVDGDGDTDVAGAEYFVADGSFAWFERTADPSASTPDGTWARRVIAGDVGPSIQLSFIEDLYGDGVLRAIGSNHTNTARGTPDPWESAVYVFDLPAPSESRNPWPRAQISTGIVSAPGSFLAPMGAPGIFGTGDIDGDGDIDVLLSGDGDKRVFWIEQLSPGRFETHVLEDPLGQAGGMRIADLDGDGRNELVVTGYEANVIYVYVRD